MPPIEMVSCIQHKEGELWIVCTHATTENARPVRVKDANVAGEVLCESCRKALDHRPRAKHRGAGQHLRLACGKCVNARWGAS